MEIIIKNPKICKKCTLSESEETKFMAHRHVCNKCRNTRSNKLLLDRDYFREYSEKNKESISLKKKEYYIKKKQLLLQTIEL